MLERTYQARLIRKLEGMFPGCFILKNDSGYLQGVPDLLILHGRNWAMLEVKMEADSSHRPNQDYYVNLLNGLSFAAFINPSNETEILRGLQQALEA